MTQVEFEGFSFLNPKPPHGFAPMGPLPTAANDGPRAETTDNAQVVGQLQFAPYAPGYRPDATPIPPTAYQMDQLLALMRDAVSKLDAVLDRLAGEAIIGR